MRPAAASPLSPPAPTMDEVEAALVRPPAG
jgi:hypothetical protein